MNILAERCRLTQSPPKKAIPEEYLAFETLMSQFDDTRNIVQDHLNRFKIERLIALDAKFADFEKRREKLAYLERLD